MDCMKMWPWMRDLPTSVWAGRGWAFDENGLRRLTSTGGSGAMQGVEVFESVGAAAEELKPKDAIVREAASAAPHAALPVACAEGLKPSRFQRHNLVKQSGVSGVKWDRALLAWQVQIPKYDSKGKRTGNTNRVFSVKKFMVNGRSEAEADAAALEAAKAFHAELVRKGILEEPKERDPNFASDVPGVGWHQKKGKWQVRIALKKSNPKEPKKNDLGRLFHREGGGRGRGLAAPRAARPAARGEGCEHLVGAARVRAKGAVCWGEVEPGGTTMACSVRLCWCAPPFQGEAQRSHRGRTGAFLPSGSGLEEEAGEGEGEDGEVQAKAPEDAPQVQQPEVLSCKYRKLRKSCTSQLSNCKMLAKSCQSAGKHSDPSCPFQDHSCIFSLF